MRQKRKNYGKESQMMSDITIQQWNDAAESFAESQEHSNFAEINQAIIKQRFKTLNGEKVLDLGCGYGFYTDYFRSIGGISVGIDGAKAMLDIARNKFPDCSFSLADITRPLTFDSDSFDIVFCNLVLMDIDPIEKIIAECSRILKPRGVFWYSIVHPAFFCGDWQTDENGYQFGKLITSYLSSKVTENRFWGKTMHFHRPLSCYLNAAADAGLVLSHIEEPRSYDNKTKNEDLPLFFIAEYKKQK